ncbi:hypothetical protein CNMCM7691_005262 [Aspergillus felis]|uniref:Uncharacterized protein n=1 Tax=Aspergillus felis TaxID=1287682 RepID=A0A8H6R5Y9_9EURO|nr:hypothetical protein CNMCM7691_005262 [Aspergillus felis]
MIRQRIGGPPEEEASDGLDFAPHRSSNQLQLVCFKQDRVTGLPAIITTFVSAGNSISAGDVGIELDSTVAAHLQALLSGSDNSNCDVGADFFPSSSLRTHSLDMASVICGAENVLADGIGRDGYPDWLLMNQGGFP